MKKAKKVILSVTLSLLAAILIFIVVVGHFPFAFNGGTAEQKYSSVLQTAFADNGDVPITKIALLGSHDALSYNINYGSKPNVSEDVITNNGFVRFIGKGALVRYSKAQKDDIYTQLNCGVRYIDVRITNIDGVYYTSHGLVSHKLKDSLLQILKFLSENAGEYIIFHIVHYYAGNSNRTELCKYISKIKLEDKCLYDYVYDTPSTPTYNDMTDGGKKAGVLLLSDSMEENEYSTLFNRIGINSKWHNITNSAALKNAVNDYAQTLSAPSCLVVNQAQTTPNGNDVWGIFTGWSLIDMAARHNERMINSEEFDFWLSKMPIYMCDYTTCTRSDFNKRINEKILQFNKSL